MVRRLPDASCPHPSCRPARCAELSGPQPRAACSRRDPIDLARLSAVPPAASAIASLARTPRLTWCCGKRAVRSHMASGARWRRCAIAAIDPRTPIYLLLERRESSVCLSSPGRGGWRVHSARLCAGTPLVGSAQQNPTVRPMRGSPSTWPRAIHRLRTCRRKIEIMTLYRVSA